MLLKMHGDEDEGVILTKKNVNSKYNRPKSDIRQADMKHMKGEETQTQGGEDLRGIEYISNIYKSYVSGQDLSGSK